MRDIEKLCKTDTRFMWLLQGVPAPSYMTIYNFMNETLLGNIKDVFDEINGYIFSQEKVDRELLHRQKFCKCESNRVIRLNEELTSFHKEDLGNLNCIHDALLRMNRSIQAEGAFGAIKWNKSLPKNTQERA